MGAQSYLNLGVVRLQVTEEWSCEGEGLLFVLPRSGKARYRVGERTQPLVGGDVLVVGRSGGGKLSVADGTEAVFSAFTLNLEHILSLFSSDEIASAQTVFDGFREFRLYSHSSTIAEQCQGMLTGLPPQSDLEHRSQLLRVASVVLAAEWRQLRSRQTRPARFEDHVLKLFEELAASDLLNLAVGDLARKFNCSRRHLNRLFHQHFGLSVASLKMEMRLLRAISLLRNRDAKVITVAEECGFNHLGLFNTVFKKRFGVSPGEWRRASARQEQQHSGQAGSAPACRMQASGLCPWALSAGPARLDPAQPQAADVAPPNGSPRLLQRAERGRKAA